MKKLKIILTKGLPASGKSTWAKDLIDKNPEKYKRVNKDDLRSMIDNGKWSKKNETFIKKVRDDIVRNAIRSGYNVIVDDTNLDDSHLNRMKEIANEFTVAVDSIHGVECSPYVEVEVKDFSDVPLEECLRRDSLRTGTAHVGEKVIRGFYNQYLKKEIKPIEYDEDLPNAIICDLDGTLALKCDRNIYDYTKVIDDNVNVAVKSVVDAMISKYNPVVVICSGRDDDSLDETVKWMDKNNIVHNFIYMRKTGDKRKDAIVKQEIYDEHIKGHCNILAVFDDRDQVVEMWRNNGLPVFQVADGDF